MIVHDITNETIAKNDDVQLVTGKKGAKQEYAYESIKDAILKNTFSPSQLLNEKDLSAHLGGISRTPIRDALRKLMYEGLVDYVPGKGMFVSDIRFEDLLEISEIRIPLERTCVELFIQRASREDIDELRHIFSEHTKAYEDGDYAAAVEWDNAFHRHLGKCTYNIRMSMYIDTLIDQSTRGAFLTVQDPRRVVDSIQEHRAILEAIEAGDVATATDKLNKHLESWTNYVAMMQMKRYYFKRK